VLEKAATIGHQKLYLYESTIDIGLFSENPFQHLLENEILSTEVLPF
jgi:hypothetical protein